MAIETECQTPGAVFHTRIVENEVTLRIDLPGVLDLTEEQARELEVNLHNATELVLSKYWHLIREH